MNNPITLITLGYILLLAVHVTMRSSANFRTVFSKNQNVNPLDAEAKQILTQNDHSRSFKVICFGVNEEPLRAHIVQYNNCGFECEGAKDIASERSENRHLRRPHSHLMPPL